MMRPSFFVCEMRRVGRVCLRFAGCQKAKCSFIVAVTMARMAFTADGTQRNTTQGFWKALISPGKGWLVKQKHRPCPFGGFLAEL